MPESVYGALKGVQDSVTALARAVATGKADTDRQIAEVKDLAVRASALSVERWTNLAKALVPLAVAIIGGTYGVQRLAAPAQAAPMTAPRTLLDTKLDECRPLPAGSLERFECFKRVEEETELRPRR